MCAWLLFEAYLPAVMSESAWCVLQLVQLAYIQKLLQPQHAAV